MTGFLDLENILYFFHTTQPSGEITHQYQHNPTDIENKYSHSF